MTEYLRLQDFGADPMQVSRWRRWTDPEQYEKEREAIAERVVKQAERWESATSSLVTNEWYTPEKYIEAAHEVMGGIDLDPASCELANEIVRATEFYATDGLARDWRGRVFLNPPYGKEDGESVASLFCKKAIHEHGKGNTKETIILANSPQA